MCYIVIKSGKIVKVCVSESEVDAIIAWLSDISSDTILVKIDSNGEQLQFKPCWIYGNLCGGDWKKITLSIDIKEGS